MTISRRSFLKLKKSELDKKNNSSPEKEDKITMLTQNGELVEINRSVIEGSTKKRKAERDDVHFWIKNKE